MLQDVLAYEAAPDLPKSRPNSMNRYGLILNDIGLESQFDGLMRRFIQPFASLLLVRETGGCALDTHHSFMVQYMQGEDVKLDMHTDDSEVTLNVNICDEFEGAGLTFCGLYGSEQRRKVSRQYAHVRGRAVIHAGLHTHGADDIASGRRFNIIVWCRSSEFRRSEAFLEKYRKATLLEEEPDLRCLSRTHDQDYTYWSKALATKNGGGNDGGGIDAEHQHADGSNGEKQ